MNENVENMEKNRVFVLDSFALAFRSFYACINNPLKNSKGEPVSVVYGYCNTVLRLLSEENPSHFMIAKDLPGGTFRHELYAEYKANRSEMPEEMKVQLPVLDEFLNICGLPALGVEGFEADDVMASLVKQADKTSEVYLVTRDKDLAQMVSDKSFLFNLEKSGVKNSIMTSAGVLDKFGVRPDQTVDYLALVGDSSDNIPGVAKEGPKTAVALLGELDNLEEIYNHIN